MGWLMDKVGEVRDMKIPVTNERQTSEVLETSEVLLATIEEQIKNDVQLVKIS